MRNINLLPQIPWFVQYLIPMILIINIIFLIPATLIVYMGWSSNMSSEAIKKEIVQKENRVEQLKGQLKTEATTLVFQRFSDEIKTLKDNRRYWVPVFEMISKSLPDTSRVTRMNVNTQEEISIRYQFEELVQVADYLVSLQSSELTERVDVNSISRSEQTRLIEDPIETSTVTVLPVATEESPEVTSESPKIASSTSHGNLLDELNQLVNDKIFKDTFGLEIPNPASTETEDVTPENSRLDELFSRDEIEQARERLKELQNPSSEDPIVPSNGGGESPTRVDPIPSDAEPAAPATEQIIYYEVSMTILLQNLNEEK